MKYYYTLILICASFFLLKSNDEPVLKNPVSTTVNEEAIRTAVPTWDELKNRDYDLKEFGLLSNEKSTLFIKVFMAKIKYIKRNAQNPEVNLNLPLNPDTKRIDEKKLIERTKLEILNLLGFYEADVLPANSTRVSIFNPNK